ncbi:MAG: lipoate--protein ligase [Clostridia bacterium]|nr:lipoate--protein ligase [Clostridia bacterium]
MMYLIKNNSIEPAFNIALEEYFLSSFEDEFFCFWRNRPSVIIGRNQDALAEINMAYIKSHNIDLVRRPSGGGAVFHDLGNVNFSYITPCEKSDCFDFERFASPVISALGSLGIEVKANGRKDLTLNGLKISGNAQRMHRGRLLQHGTLLFCSDFGYMQGALNADPRKLQGKGISSIKSRVTNICDHLPQAMSTEDFIAHLETHIMSYFDNIREYKLDKSDIDAINSIADSKYRTDEWTLSHMGKYTFQNSQVFPYGIVSLGLDVADGKIRDISITGDFFGTGDIADLCDIFKNTAHTPDAINQIISHIDIDSYISGANTDDIIGLFF